MPPRIRGRLIVEWPNWPTLPSPSHGCKAPYRACALLWRPRAKGDHSAGGRAPHPVECATLSLFVACQNAPVSARMVRRRGDYSVILSSTNTHARQISPGIISPKLAPAAQRV